MHIFITHYVVNCVMCFLFIVVLPNIYYQCFHEGGMCIIAFICPSGLLENKRARDSVQNLGAYLALAHKRKHFNCLLRSFIAEKVAILYTSVHVQWLKALIQLLLISSKR